ncbi:MAG: adenine nucleotide alpha hydrolase family protein [Deltaproteobacteria bacterium]|nr:adenine nucleotide alpha hydrolase family protein [Deltaproteobacteria bacterium]
MKCTRCHARAEVHIRHHNSAFCRGCYGTYFQRQVERAIHKEHMFTPDEDVLVAVSGGKDSLALWDALVTMGYRTTGLHLALGIGDYSAISTRKTEHFARERGLRLLTVPLEDETPGLGIMRVAGATNRKACAACGTVKRHYFDRIAAEQGFQVVATGHNLDDEAARLLGNVLHWQSDHLAKQSPVLVPTHEKFARKVKPFFRISEYETAVYAFFRGIDYVLDECPNSAGATQLVYKDVLNRLEAAMPGTKLTFVQEFLRTGRPAFAGEASSPPQTCESCGMPSYNGTCGFCRLVAEVTRRRNPLPHAGPA